MRIYQSATNSATSTSVVKAFSSALTGGTTLWAGVKTNISGNAITMSDTLSQTWTSAGFVDDATTNSRTQLFYVANSTAGACTVTASVSSSAATYLIIAEVGGATITTPFIAEAGATGTGTALSSGTFTSGSNALVAGLFYSSGGNPSTGSGFTAITNISNLNLQLKTSTVTPDSVDTTATTGNWIAIGASFTSAIGVASSIPQTALTGIVGYPLGVGNKSNTGWSA